MPFFSVTEGAWRTVVTTTGNTVFQNRGGGNLFLTTEATGALGRDEGSLVEPLAAIVISSGKAVKVNSANKPGVLHYMEI